MNASDTCAAAALRTDADVAVPALAARHDAGCACVLHARRRLGGALFGSGLLAASPAFAKEAAPAVKDEECKISVMTKAVSAAQIEQSAAQQYVQMLQEANSQRALAPKEHPQVERLRYIASRIVPYTTSCNANASQWRWEVNLIGSKQLNAFCMPGGKIAFYYGILDNLKLNDDEVAAIMGHEIAHALLEHARERMGKTMATRGVLEIGSVLLGLGDLGRMAAAGGAQLLSLKFSRSDESEADALGLVLAARAGYNPAAGISLWQKMINANKGAPPQWLSTHPSGTTRIKEMQARMARVMPIYTAAQKPDRHFGAPTSVDG